MRIALLNPFVALLFITACSSESSSTPSTDASMDSETPIDGGVDAGQECARDEMGRCLVVTWTDGPTFPVQSDHHTTFVHSHSDGAYVYVAGGLYVIDEAIQSMSDQLRRAQVQEDGSLGDWTNVLSLSSERAFHGQAQSPDRVYLMGGVTMDGTEPVLVDDVDIVELTEASGVRVRSGRRLGVARVHATGHILGNHLYLVGGSSEGGTVQQTVLVSDLDEHGTNGPWRESVVLPAPRTHHAGIVHDGHIYLFGGLTTASAEVNEVWRSVNTPDGVISGWETVGTMSEAPWTASAFEYNNQVYIVGGGHGLPPAPTMFVDRVRRAPLLLDGSVGEFEDVAAPLPMRRSHCHQTPVYNGHIYAVGGRHDENAPTSIDNVYIGAINEVMMDTDAGVPDASTDAGPPITDAGPGLTAAEAIAQTDVHHLAIYDFLCGCVPTALGFEDEAECRAVSMPYSDEFVACRDSANALANPAMTLYRRCAEEAAAAGQACFDALTTCSTDGLRGCLDELNVAEDFCYVAPADFATVNEARRECAAATIVGDAADTCSDAAGGSSAVGSAVFHGDTRQAGDHRNGSCAEENAAADVTFKWVAPSAGSFTVELVPESRFTGLLYVLDGTCAGAELGCTSTGIRFPYTAELNFTAVAGNTYNVVVDGFSNSDTGTFHINVTPTP